MIVKPGGKANVGSVGEREAVDPTLVQARSQ